MRFERLLLGLLLLAVLAPRALYVLQPDEGRVAIPVVDDGYYNLTIARNVAAGRGFTFDGTAVTTGFHPLVVLVAVPVFAACGGGTTAPLRVILTIYALLGVLLGWMIYRVVRRVGGPGTALIALLLYATSPATGMLVNTLNGCDTVFGGILLTGFVCYWLAAVRGRADPGARRYLVLGLLGGSLGLARLDLGIFAAVLGVVLLVGMLKHPASLRLGRLALYVIGGLAMITPWVVMNLALTGRPLPDNGRAVTLISRATAASEVRLGEHGLLRSFGGADPAPRGGLEPYPGDRVPPAFYRTMLTHGGLAALRESPPTGLLFTTAELATRGLERLGLTAASRQLRLVGFPFLASIAGGALILVLLWLRRRRLGELPEEVRGLWFLVPAGLLLFAAYPLVVFGSWFFGRYYFPLAVLSLLLLPVIARVLTRSWTPVKVALVVVIAVGGFLLDSGPGLLRPAPRNFYEQARRVAERLPADAVVGAIQAGHLGFFAPQRVINLDGKVNSRAHRALAERRVLDYARSEQVRFITDWPDLVELLIVKRSSAQNRRRLRRIDPAPGDPRRENELGWATWILRP